MKYNTLPNAEIADCDVARLLQLYSELQQPNYELPCSITVESELQKALKETESVNGLT